MVIRLGLFVVLFFSFFRRFLDVRVKILGVYGVDDMTKVGGTYSILHVSYS